MSSSVFHMFRYARSEQCDLIADLPTLPLLPGVSRCRGTPGLPAASRILRVRGFVRGLGTTYTHHLNKYYFLDGCQLQRVPLLTCRHVFHVLEGDHLLSHWLKVGRMLTQSNHPSIIRFLFCENKFSRMFFSINVYSPFISSFLPSIQGFQQISPYFRLDKVGRSVTGGPIYLLII